MKWLLTMRSFQFSRKWLWIRGLQSYRERLCFGSLNNGELKKKKKDNECICYNKWAQNCFIFLKMNLKCFSLILNTCMNIHRVLSNRIMRKQPNFLYKLFWNYQKLQAKKVSSQNAEIHSALNILSRNDIFFLYSINA